jgi:cytochrome P450
MVDQTVATLPISRSCPYAPPAEHVRLREEAPVSRVRLPNGSIAWALARHEDIRTMLADPRFSSDRRKPGFPSFGPSRSAGDASGGFPLSLVGMDEPEHQVARRSVVGEFTVKRMAALRPRIQQIVDEHIDAILAGPRPVDLVQALSLPVPSLVTCGLLGVPYSDHDFFQGHSGRLLRRTTPPEERGRIVMELLSFLDDLVAGKEAEPTDDLIGRQIRKQRDAGTTDHQALVHLGLLLLVAGHETTANMISLGTIALLRRPEDIATILENPGKTPEAVEELLRYFTISEFAVSRVATEDVEIGGMTIRAGEGVLILGNAANRDPAAFDDPDELDIERGAMNHVTFGYGAHQCLGQNLARLELQIVFDTLFRRIPGLRLATPAEDLPFKDDAAVYGVYELPVTW